MTSDPCDHPASIHLDYGADSAPFDFSSLHICQRGMRLRTRWFFEPGTELSVNFQLAESGAGLRASDEVGNRIFRTEGVVVECQPEFGGDGFEVTMVFLEVTDDILAVIRDVLPASAMHG